MKKTTQMRKTFRRLMCLALCAILSFSTLVIAMADEEIADLTVLGVAYTREEIVAMPATEYTHTRVGSSGEEVNEVRGVLLADLLADVDDDAVIEFSVLDGWSGISAYTMTKAELVEGNAILAYEIMEDGEWVVYVNETEFGVGYFRLWVDEMRGASGVNVISLGEDEIVIEAPPEIGPVNWLGDASPDDFDIKIVGLVDVPGYFTVEGLVEFAAEFEQTRDYSWTNRSSSTDIDTFTGIYMEDLLTSLMGVSSYAKGLLIISDDGFENEFFLNDEAGGAYWVDAEENQMMLAWNGTESREDRDIVDFDLPRIAIGQINEQDFNRQRWSSNVTEIRVTAFGDMKGHASATEAIDALAVNEVTLGVGGDRFDPSGTLDRAMFITFLGRALKAETDGASEENRLFTDVDYDDYYGIYVEWAYELGLVQGHGDGTFGPNDDLLVEHMILIAGRAGIESVPEDIEQAAGYATRAQAARIIHALMLQLAD